MMLNPALMESVARQCKSAIHVGAHVGQEAATYAAWGITDVLWIEANAELLDELRANVEQYGHQVVHACLGAKSGETVTFHIADEASGANHGQSSSVLELGTHKQKHPEVFYRDHVEMVTRTLDEVVAETVPEWMDRGDMLLSTDVQGLDLDVLRGGRSTLAASILVMQEVNVDPLYVNAGLFPDLDAFLVENGFEVQEVLLAGCQRRDCSDGGSKWTGWGDHYATRAINPRPFAETHSDLFAAWYP